MIVFGYLGYHDMGVSQFRSDFPVVGVAITPKGRAGHHGRRRHRRRRGCRLRRRGRHYVMSRSLEGTSLVTVYFQLTRSIDAAMQDVQNAVSRRAAAAARHRSAGDLQGQSQQPAGDVADAVGLIPARRALPPLKQISDFAEKEFKQQLAAILEVGGVQFGGLQSRNIRIHRRLQARLLQPVGEDLAQAVQRQHTEMPAGLHPRAS